MLLSENAKEPTKISPQKSGFEIYVSEEITIPPHETAIVPTDVVINVPYGYEGEVRPRYAINAETKLRVNTVFVNATDKEPINIITDNIGNETITIEQGKCLAELVIKPVSYMENITVGSF
ncbi:dUTP pyrophosphatase [Staphylococcus cohnii]|nr:dUTP pyrophosphatase [Staphylococcus cohnii]